MQINPGVLYACKRAMEILLGVGSLVKLARFLLNVDDSSTSVIVLFSCQEAIINNGHLLHVPFLSIRNAAVFIIRCQVRDRNVIIVTVCNTVFLINDIEYQMHTYRLVFE